MLLDSSRTSAGSPTPEPSQAAGTFWFVCVMSPVSWCSPGLGGRIPQWWPSLCVLGQVTQQKPLGAPICHLHSREMKIPSSQHCCADEVIRTSIGQCLVFTKTTRKSLQSISYYTQEQKSNAQRRRGPRRPQVWVSGTEAPNGDSLTHQAAHFKHI